MPRHASDDYRFELMPDTGWRYTAACARDIEITRERRLRRR